MTEWLLRPKKPRKCLICGGEYIPTGSAQKACLGSKCREILTTLYWKRGMSKRELASFLGVYELSIYNWFKKLDIPCRRTAEANAVKKVKNKWINNNGIWRPKQSKELSYILGVMKGDGNIYKKRIQFRTIDKIFAEKFAHYLHKIGIHSYPMFVEKRSINPNYKNSKDVYCIFASSMLFARWYNGLSLENLEEEVSDFLEEFLCGFYESEGTIYDNHGYLRITISSTDKGLLHFVYQSIRHLGFKPTFILNKRNYRPNHKICYRVTICKQKEVPKFIETINPCIKIKPKGGY